jgi:hypothetical protein
MEYDSTANVNPLYEYKKSGILTKLSTKLDLMFGRLDYNKMKSNHHLRLNDVEFEYTPVPPPPFDDEFKGDRFEYMTEEYSCKPDLGFLNSRGKEGWELTSVLTSGNIIWKRKINI